MLCKTWVCFARAKRELTKVLLAGLEPQNSRVLPATCPPQHPRGGSDSRRGRCAPQFSLLWQCREHGTLLISITPAQEQERALQAVSVGPGEAVTLLGGLQEAKK